MATIVLMGFRNQFITHKNGFRAISWEMGPPTTIVILVYLYIYMESNVMQCNEMRGYGMVWYVYLYIYVYPLKKTITAARLEQTILWEYSWIMPMM